jgi:hypothetical protein
VREGKLRFVERGELAVFLGDSHDLNVRTVLVLLKKSAHMAVDQSYYSDAQRGRIRVFSWFRLGRNTQRRRTNHGRECQQEALEDISSHGGSQKLRGHRITLARGCQ